MQTDGCIQPPHGAGRRSGYETYRRTRPALDAYERWGQQRNESDRVEYNQIRGDFAGGTWCSRDRYDGNRQIRGAGQMADAANAVRRAVFGRRSGLVAVMHMMFAHIHIRVRHGLRCRGFRATALQQLHGYRCRQCASGENRQPEQHEYGNEFPS